MTTAAIALTGEEALKLVAGDPDIADKTPDDLREVADGFEQLAQRKDRLIVADGLGRRGARTKAREREGEKLRIQAQVTRAAAEEVEARKCPTVGGRDEARLCAGAEADREGIVTYTSDKAIVLKIAAEKLGLDSVAESACAFETHDNPAGTIWRVRVVGDGKAPTYVPGEEIAESVTCHEVVVTEREIVEADA
jgi:hypothetical protein